MYRSILVPLDGSPFAEHALPLALGLARRAGAALKVVQVHTSYVYVESGLVHDKRLDQQLRGQARDYLASLIPRLTAASAVPITSHLLEGEVSETLSEYAATTDTDLIVLTTHGRGPLSRFWLGSVADELVRRATVPLLLVRPQNGAPDLTREPELRNVLVPLDGSELAEQVLGPAVGLGRLLDADYTLLRVVKPILFPGHDPAVLGIPPLGQPATGELQAAARAYLDGVAERLRAQALRVQTRLVVDAQPAAAILEQTESSPPGVVALATHGRGGLARALLGSVADKIIRGATGPVFVWRPRP